MKTKKAELKIQPFMIKLLFKLIEAQLSRF